MAYRGGATGQNPGSSSTVTVNVSGIGIQSGDVVLLCGMFGGSGSLTPTWPSGFAAVPGLSNVDVNNGGSQTFAIVYKIAGSSEPSSYTVTPGGDFYGLTCTVFSGRSATPFDAVATTANTAFASDPYSYSLSGVTASSGDDLVAFVGILGYGGEPGWAVTAPTGFANEQTATTAGVSYYPACASMTDTNWAGGSTGTISGGQITGAGSGPYYPVAFAGYVIALSAASGGSSPPIGQIWI